MPTRQQLHALVDQLADDQVQTVYRVALALGADPLLFSLLTAPLDDEPETEQERAAVEQARQAVASGEKCLTTEELSQELGL